MKVKLFATLRQIVGAKEIEVSLEVGDTVGSVLAIFPPVAGG
jgi:molybdopterin converting factor small subunit